MNVEEGMRLVSLGLAVLVRGEECLTIRCVHTGVIVRWPEREAPDG